MSPQLSPLSLHRALSYCLIFFNFNLKNCSISYRADWLNSPLVLKNSFARFLVVCSLQQRKYVKLLLSGPHGFCYENSYFVDNPVYITITSLLLLSRFSLPLYSLSIILEWIFLNLSFLEFLKLLGYGDSCVLSRLGSFLLSFLQIFLVPLFSFFFWDSYNACACSCPMGLLGSVDFFSLFSFFSSEHIV